METPRGVVAVGASDGGVEALQAFTAELPADLAAPVLIVMHVPSTGASALPGILARVTTLPVTHAEDGEPLRPGHVYVAPPDRHLLVSGRRARLSREPRQNGHRPAVDPLFRSAVREYGPGVVAVVLSGTLDDGAAGAARVARAKGVVGVQDPDEAAYTAMPRGAIDASGTDLVLPVRDLARHAAALCRTPGNGEAGGGTSGGTGRETGGEPEHRHGPDGDCDGDYRGIYTCPECGGPLYEVSEGGQRHLRCRIGHRWSIDGLIDHQATAVENALWTAVRTLEERGDLTGRMADGARSRGSAGSADRFTETSRESHRAAEVIRGLLQDGGFAGPADEPGLDGHRPYDDGRPESTEPRG